ncbi:hypothetical protein [Amycolatopsis magusensis]|uniref:hypothetical protein n=1 Tax=Amycolatopsis magusensis TaxID=882444 RepID=UPI00379AEB7E
MTQDSGSEQHQKTVAELLAQHGGQGGGSRRRRRRADDEEEAPRRDISDTAPQAIIERIQGDTPPPANRRNGTPRRSGSRHDSGALPRPPRQDSGALPRPPQDSGALPRPQQESGALPRPPQQESGALPRPPQDEPPPRRGPRRGAPEAESPVDPPTRRVPTRARRQQPPPPPPPQPAGPPSGGLSARLDGLDEAEAPPVEPEPGPPPSGAYPVPPRAPRRRGGPVRRPAPPTREEHTEQIPVIPDEPANGPPSGYNSGYSSGYASGYQSGFTPRPQQPVQPPPPPEPEPDEPPAGLAGWRQRRDQERLEDTQAAMTPVDDDPIDADPAGGQFASGRFSTGDFEAVQRPVAGELGGPAYADDFDGPPSRTRSVEYDDGFDAELEAEVDELDDPYAGAAGLDAVEDRYEEASPGKQWLVMGAQLGLGVIGGAGVWLGFNWLWDRLPGAALIAALVVIVALVWIVWKIRRATDPQTTVLAVLVGLVVTVSPAALLLLSK